MVDAHELTNGRYTTRISDAGSGYSWFGALALTRWVPDRTRDADGFFLYLRDLESGLRWSAGYQPIRAPARRYEVRADPRRVAIVREDDDVEVTTEISVPAGDDVEVRRYTIANRGTRARRLELTTYAELVLNSPAADAGHPAFSKLFVQTEHLASHDALIAWRRLRAPDDEPLWVVHRFLGGPDTVSELETDRARFLGRGRTTADPAALAGDAPLSGTVGNVLDPIVSLRRRVTIEPGSVVRLAAVLGAGRTREEVVALAERYATLDAVEAVLEVAARGGPPPKSNLASATELGVILRAQAASPPFRPSAAPARTIPASPGGSHQFFNGFGGFSSDGTEYVIGLDREPDGLRWPPLPWTNVIANEQVGFVVSESGAGNTWSANSREHRLTPWANDPISDPHGEALWLRDEIAGEFWSPMPGPTPGAAAYEVRHGLGYTRWSHGSAELTQETTVFVPRHDPVRITRLRLTNRADRPRRLSLVSYAQWVLGGEPWRSGQKVVTRRHEESGAVLATSTAADEFAGRVAFAAFVVPAERVHVTADRTAFLGRYGELASPAAIANAAADAPQPLDGRVGEGFDQCAALWGSFELAAGATAECAVLLGDATDEAAALQLVRRYRRVEACDQELDDVCAFWREMTSAVQITTPSPAIDLMVNAWLPYQNLSCRVWGRSALYQSGGAYGFRDQLQDTAALLHLEAAITRRQIVLHASHQFVEGDVLHWWHPPASKGIRTRFADDLLWLPFVTAYYTAMTGDAAVLDEDAPFVAARELEAGEDEIFVHPTPAGTSATVYEHCCRAIDRSLTRGEHGLPLMGTGDWNDGMNRVGREGRGESVWLGFFLFDILRAFIPICESRGDGARVDRYREHQSALAESLNDGGWDGAWYRRAYYDDGTPLGAAASDECRIDTIAQAWAVISGAAPAERAEQAMDAMERYLVSEEDGIIRLLTPPFDRTPHDPGYIKGYLPGVRENGGQYTHGALWGVRALAESGRCDRAVRLLEMLSPVTRSRTPADVERYRTEPYSIAADVYGVAPHIGRGGWTWYTGSAGWMWRVAVESILGLTREGDRLVLCPRIPSSWPGFKLRYRLDAARSTYAIEVVRSSGAVTTATLDGGELPVHDGVVRVPLDDDGAEHAVRVTLGADATPRYRPAPLPALRGEGQP